MFGATKRLGEKMAIALEKEAEEWMKMAERSSDPKGDVAMNNRYVYATIRAIAKVIREVTKDE